MKAFKNKSENFKLNTSPNRQPVKTIYAGSELRVQIFSFFVSQALLLNSARVGVQYKAEPQGLPKADHVNLIDRI